MLVPKLTCNIPLVSRPALRKSRWSGDQPDIVPTSRIVWGLQGAFIPHIWWNRITAGGNNCLILRYPYTLYLEKRSGTYPSTDFR